MARPNSPRHVRKKSRTAKRAPASEVESAAPAGPVRVHKLLAHAGVASRRAAEAFIREGRVTINGKTAKIGDVADPAVDRVALDGEGISAEVPVYWLVHKPRGVLSTVSDPHGRRTVLGLLPKHIERIYPVGRLDSDSEGLVLLTNDGAMAHALLHPSLQNEREYQITVRGELGEKELRRLKKGVLLDDGHTGPVEISKLRFDPETETTRFHMTLKQGRKRQIRRMMLAVRFPVRRLVRVRMGPQRLGRLARGEARVLRADEVRALRRHVEALRAEPAGRRGKSARRPSVNRPRPKGRSGPDSS